MRIVLDPPGMQAAAGRMRAAAGELQALSGQIACAALPEMPPDVRAAVEGRLRAAGNGLLIGADEIHGAAGALDRRARQATLAGQGGGSAFRPGLQLPLWGLLRLKGMDNASYWAAYRDGKNLRHNASEFWNPKHRRGNDLWFNREGSRYWNLKGYTPKDLQRARLHPEQTKYSAAYWRYKTGGNAAAASWGKGRNQLAIGEVGSEAKAGVKLDKFRGGAAAGAGASANLVRGSVGFGGRYGEAEAGGSVGANANANAGLGYDFKKKQIAGQFGGGAFAGGEVHAGAGVKAGGYAGAKGTVGASYGIGGTADAEVEIGSKVHVKAKIGATLGLGVNVGVDVEVDPVKIVKDIF